MTNTFASRKPLVASLLLLPSPIQRQIAQAISGGVVRGIRNHPPAAPTKIVPFAPVAAMSAQQRDGQHLLIGKAPLGSVAPTSIPQSTRPLAKAGGGTIQGRLIASGTPARRGPIVPPVFMPQRQGAPAHVPIHPFARAGAGAVGSKPMSTVQPKSVLQRSAAPFTRSELAKLTEAVANSKTLKGIYSGAANANGTSYDNDPAKFLLEQKQMEVTPTSRSPAKKFGVGAHTVTFSWKAATYTGLEPGVDSLFKCHINYTGTRTGDFALASMYLADAKLGSLETADTVWHHYHDWDPKPAPYGSGTLHLMTKAKHATSHYGGMFQFNGST